MSAPPEFDFSQIHIAVFNEAMTAEAAVVRRIQQRSATLGKQLAAHLPPFVPPRVVEDWNWRAKVMGKFVVNEDTVYMNMRLIDAQSNAREHYDETFAHETAHYVQKRIVVAAFGRFSKLDEAHHGSIWQAVMRAMGRQPDARVSGVDVAAAFPKTYAAADCVCGKRHSVTRRRVAGVQKRQQWFVCVCGAKVLPEQFRGSRR